MSYRTLNLKATAKLLNSRADLDLAPLFPDTA